MSVVVPVPTEYSALTTFSTLPFLIPFNVIVGIVPEVTFTVSEKFKLINISSSNLFFCLLEVVILFK